MAEGSSKAKEIDLGENFGDVVVKANGAQVKISADGSIRSIPAPANDTAAKSAHEIGDIESDGDHKGGMYGGIFPDGKPIWFLAAPKSMDHFNAAAWATKQGGALPTRAQGGYLTTLKGKGGAFTELFNRGGSFPAGYVWLAEPGTDYRSIAWCQRLSDGGQNLNHRSYELPVLCCFR